VRCLHARIMTEISARATVCDHSGEEEAVAVGECSGLELDMAVLSIQQGIIGAAG
jgi:hypothetical protein